MVKMEKSSKRKIDEVCTPPENPSSKPLRPGIVESFAQPWHPYCNKGPGFAGSSSSNRAPNNPNLQLCNLDNVVNSTHNTSDVGVNSILIDQQEDNADENLKKSISSRVLAQKSRIKKELYVVILEGKLKVLEDEIADLFQKIDALKDEYPSLLLEQNKLKLQMAISERGNTLQELEVEKNRVEMMKLSELQIEQAMEKQIRLLSNIGTNVQLMYKANINPFDLPHFLCSNSNQVPNGAVATSRTREININLQPENRTQVLMANNRGVRNENQVGMENLTENGQGSTPNYDIVKLEPSDY
nr:uncharacterized protein LOC112723751 [Arachis hypogaea]